MRGRKPLLSLHIVTSVGLLGSSFAMLLAAVTAATSDDGEFAHSIYRLMRTQTFASAVPLSFLALGSGILSGLRSKWGVLRYWWTTAKLGLLVVTILSGALVIGPAIDARLDGGGSAWGLVAAVGGNVAMLLAAAVVSVFRPGGRRVRAPS